MMSMRFLYRYHNRNCGRLAGQVLRKISPYFAIVLGAYALARFVEDLRG